MITVVTPTVGRSARRLEVLMREMRAFTRLPFRHVVSDDGTPDEAAVREQEEVCARHGAEHTRNPGPPFGLPANLNHAVEQVRTPWAYVVEDGVRPSWGWLEAASSLVRQVSGRTFEGMPVAMCGVSHIEDYVLAAGGAIPQPAPDTFCSVAGAQRTPEARACFYGDWNDGLWCWPRLLRRMSVESLSRSSGDEAFAAAFVRDRAESRPLLWPTVARAVVAYAPGGLLLVDVDAWRELGRFRRGCSCYEGHLGVRVAMAGRLSLWLNGPPWLHSPSQGFSDPLTHAMYRDRNVESLGKEEVFLADFGFRDTTSGMPLIASERHSRAGKALESVQVEVVPEWGEWR